MTAGHAPCLSAAGIVSSGWHVPTEGHVRPHNAVPVHRGGFVSTCWWPAFYYYCHGYYSSQLSQGAGGLSAFRARPSPLVAEPPARLGRPRAPRCLQILPALTAGWAARRCQLPRPHPPCRGREGEQLLGWGWRGARAERSLREHRWKGVQAALTLGAERVSLVWLRFPGKETSFPFLLVPGIPAQTPLCAGEWEGCAWGWEKPR